ncbi:hypothetical protein [uncultured Shimia sp.]|uniref:hypothetical protein n=1 Tax=uncultured Shimia sp. TaxID=573152 RepID=UPI00260760BF|nr:hypothetical protein [uncultured Shimia sp.]
MGMRIVKANPDPLTASVVTVNACTADVTIRAGDQVRISDTGDIRTAIGLYLIDNGFTGNETIHIRTLQRSEWACQSNEYTNLASGLTKTKAAKLRKASRP